MRRTLTFLTLLGALGVFISLYLLFVHYSETYVCGVGDCDYVNKSAYSEVFGVPVALLSLLAFSYFSALSLLGIGNKIRVGLAARLIFFPSLASTAYATYLQYIEFFVLQAFCLYCTILYGELLLILGLSLRSLSAK
ncbi:MAG: vitamin K epoxide reductase family protein [Candidatus Geothermarchaeales archaeon]